jgi:hypothetical protein
MERLMGRIIDVREVQKELDRAARDARRGSREVRSGRFVHANAGGGEAGPDQNKRPATANVAPPGRKTKQPRWVCRR